MPRTTESLFVLGSGLLLLMSGSLMAQELEAYPKNHARSHMGTTLETWNGGASTYMESESNALLLDDDETTGRTISTGTSHLLLALREPALLNGFALSAPGAEGTVNLYIGDEKAGPGANSWTPVATGLSISDVNEQILSGSFNKYGRYLLVELTVPAETRIYSMYLFGTERATDFHLEQRDNALTPVAEGAVAPVRTESIDMANLFSSARVSYVNNGGDLQSWQAMIDESPESFWIVSGKADSGPSVVVDLGSQKTLNRIASLIDGPAGVLEFYLLPSLGGAFAPVDGDVPAMELNTGSNSSPSSINLDNLIPVCTLGFDGATDRESINFAPATGRFLIVRWRPSTEDQTVKIRQIDAFGEAGTAQYAVVSSELPAVAEQAEDARRRLSSSSKNVVLGDGKGFKGFLDPIAEGPGFTPGAPVSLPPPMLSTPSVPILITRPTPTPTPTPPPTPPPNSP